MNDDIHGLIGPYAVDAVTPDERVRFDEHLRACEHCRAELVALRAAARELSATVETSPPPSLRMRVLSEIASVRPLPPILPDDRETSTALAEGRSTSAPTRADRRSRTRWHRPRRWLAAAAAAAAIAVGALVWHPWAGSPPSHVTAVQQVLQAPDAHRYVKHLGSTTATIVRSQDLHRAVLVADDMAPAPTGHTYQLWYFTRSGTPVSAGLVPQEPGSGRFTVALTGNAATADGVGVTVEPAGGSAQPTTKPIMTFTFTS